MPPTDAEIIRRVVAGDREAYSLLVDRYYDRCARYATHLLGNREDAEEAVQDAFVRAYQALGRYEERDQFSAWLLRIVANRCRTAAVRAARRSRTFVDAEAAEGVAAGDDPAHPFAERDRLERALAQLRPDQREAVVLRLGEELSYDEMAAVTGAGVSALKMRVARALARLRALLAEGSHV